MLISQSLADAINAQIGRELGASHQYIQIASFFDYRALDLTSKLFFEQAEEEKEHAMKFIRYLLDTDAPLRIPAVEAPKGEFASAEEAVGLALQWETEVTRQINNLMDIAVRENDYLSRQFLDWFVSEQLEEVNKMGKLLQIVRGVGDRNLYMLEAYISHLES